MATTGEPGGSCQPHTVQQLTAEKEKAGGEVRKQKSFEIRKEIEER